MSETQRKKKDGENKDGKNSRMRRETTDLRQGADRPDVAEPRHGDSFDQDLERDSKATKRGHSSEAPQ